MIFINRNVSGWPVAPAAYWSHKALYRHWKRWTENCIFALMLMGLAADHGWEQTVMFDAIYLNVHRTASRFVMKKRSAKARSET